MDNSEIEDLFKKFAQGQCTPQEKALLVKFLQESGNEDLLPEIEEVNQNDAAPVMNEKTADLIFERILSRGTSKSRHIRLFSSKPSFIAKVAAVLIGFLLLAGGFLYLAPNINVTEYRTGFGEKKNVVLPDQSIVVLNSNSSIVLDKNWRKNKRREVWLQGEAFFEITKSTEKFVVHAKSLQVEVYGTTFNVKSRRDKTSVVLNSGKVKVKVDETKKSELVDMQPGDMVEFSEENKTFVQKTVNPRKYILWQNNVLEFDNTPLGEIFQLLEDNYGFKIKLTDREILTKRFTGSAPDKDINVLIDKLEKLFNLEIKKDDDILIINKSGM